MGSRGKKIMLMGLDEFARNSELMDITNSYDNQNIEPETSILVTDDELLSIIDDALSCENEIEYENLENNNLNEVALNGPEDTEHKNIIVVTSDQIKQNEINEKSVENTSYNKKRIEEDNVEDSCQESALHEEGGTEEENTIENSGQGDVNLTETDSRNSRKRSCLRRSRGLNYVGYKRTREGKVSHNATRNSRKIKERCAHSGTEKKQKNRNIKTAFLCSEISDADRKKIFQRFWKFNTWEEKKAYVKGLVITRDIKRRRKQRGDETKKNVGHDIYLPSSNGHKVRVCRTFFLNTLDLGRDTFNRWNQLSSDLPTNDTNNKESADGPDDHIEEPLAKRRKKSISHDKIREWLGLLPKVPSHYCRSSSKKAYVESTFRSICHMYSVYEEWSKDNQYQPGSRKLFTSILKEENVAIHQPRKDQCDLCCGQRLGTVDEKTYQQHIKMKNEARVAKREAEESASPQKLILTMDMQSVLLSPKTLASKMYYKQKLQIHNFTIYEINDGNVTLYVWHEVNGGVTSNEFASCLNHFISNLDEGYKHVTLISDGCNYQNRNKVLASVLSNIAKSKDIIIEQLYLEKGHTMMQADSVHSTLEHYFKPPINSPADYISRMRAARPKKPYNVIPLDYTFFLNYEALSSTLPSLRPGKKVGDPVVVDIRGLKYLPDGEIQFRLSHSEPWETLPQRRKCGNENPKPLYSSTLPITKTKFDHLMELKSVIEPDHHAFYDELPYVADKEKKKTK